MGNTYQTRTIHTGNLIYTNFDRPDDISHLDKEIVNNTLCYDEFCANMSDDYRCTKAELQAIQTYRKKVNIFEED